MIDYPDGPAEVARLANDEAMATNRFCRDLSKELRDLDHQLWRVANVEYRELAHPAVPGWRDRPGGPTIRERIEAFGAEAARVTAELLAALPAEQEPDREGLVDRVLEQARRLR